MRTLAAISACALLGLAAAPALAQQAQQLPKPPEAPTVPPSPARLPDGHPNMTGFWVLPGGMLDVYRGPSGITGVNPAGGGNVPRARPEAVFLKSPYKEKYAATMAAAAKGPIPDQTTLCFPMGMPRMMGGIYGIEILQTPKIVAITSEYQGSTRRIWMDEKEHPPLDELDETYSGHSIGHWEGDTLVVDTIGVREDVPLAQDQFPHSIKMRIIERFTQKQPGLLTVEQTIEDADAYTEPLKSTRTYRYRDELQLKEYVCLENNRNVDPAGLPSFEK